MNRTERDKWIRQFLGKTMDIEIDRPIGYLHRKKSYVIQYPINYGYLLALWGGDGEEQDVYLLGVTEPVKRYTARIIAAVCRTDDVEDKLVAAPCAMCFSEKEIAEQIRFQEQYYHSRILMAIEDK